MRRFGVKLWTNDVFKNHQFFSEIVNHVKDGDFDYLELFVFPETFEATFKDICKEVKGVPVVIHNSHSGYGFNTGSKACEKNNLRDINDSKRFADELGADIIIVHAGNGDKPENFDETIRQFNLFNDKRIAVENLPPICGTSGNVLHGLLPDEIKRIKDETGCQFCMDFSHATCAANYKKIPLDHVFAAFCALKPDMYHLCDGMIDEINDKHLHYGEGDYNLLHLVNDYIPDGALVTMETGHSLPTSSQPWLNDYAYLRKLER